MKIKIAFVVLLIAGVVVFSLLNSRNDLSISNQNYEIKEMPFSYDRKDFGKVERKNYPKVKAESEEIETRFPVDLPAHSCFELEDKKKFYAYEKGARYFSPSYSFICFVPTVDKSEKDFAKAYPNFSEAVEKIEKLIRAKPEKLEQYKNIIDIPYNNSGWSLTSKIQYLDYKSIAGVSFLTQYTQELTPNLLNNEELTFNFQGLTGDKRFYVAARFAITHPDLPKGIDFTDSAIQKNAYSQPTLEEVGKAVSAYLKREQEKAEKFDENNFIPSMESLKNIIESISIR